MTVAERVSDIVPDILSEFADLPADAGAPLELESLVIVQLVEALEERFGFTARAAELVPENLATLAALVAWVSRRTAPPAARESTP